MLPGLLAAQIEQARAAPPTFANICTGLGVSLPVLNPVAHVADNTLSVLLQPLLGDINGGVDNVNTSLTQTLSGQRLGLSVLDPGTGQYVSLPAGSCNVSADGLQVNNNQGISIGGGQITGLGGTGNPPAVAGDTSAIAFGNGASTAVGATNALALGTSATANGQNAIALGANASAGALNSMALGEASNATAANSVALGTGSFAARGGSTYNAFGLGAPQTAAGEVSLGSIGNAHVVTNVAAGAQPTDAVNVAQLQGAAGLVGSGLSGAIGAGTAYNPTTGQVTLPSFVVGGQTYNNVGDALSASNGLTVQYTPDLNGAPTAAIDLTKGGLLGPVSMSGLAAGAVTPGSTDAINGNQLYLATDHLQVNSALPAAVAAGINSLALGGNASTGAGASNGVAIGANANVTTPGGVALGANALASRAAGTYLDPLSGGSVTTLTGGASLGAPGAERQLTNLAAGTALTDAANVGQVEAAASHIGTSVAATLGGGSGYDPATGTVSLPTFTIAGTGYINAGSAFAAIDNALTSLDSGSAGAFASNNAANRPAPMATGADASAGGFGASATGAASTAVGNGASDNNVAGSTVLGNSASVAAGLTGSNVAIGQGSTATVGARANYTAFGQAAPQNAQGEVAVGSNALGLRLVTYVASGVADTDAANVGQLKGASAELGTSNAATLGGGATYNATTNTVSLPTFTVQGGTYNNVGSAFDAVNNALTTVESSGTGAFASDNTAAAPAALASGANASAGGFGSSATGAASTVVGNGASDNGVANSTVLGNGASVTAGLTGSNVALGRDPSQPPARRRTTARSARSHRSRQPAKCPSAPRWAVSD